MVILYDFLSAVTSYMPSLPLIPSHPFMSSPCFLALPSLMPHAQEEASGGEPG